VPATEIERLIRDAFPGAEVEIRDLAGDNNHFAATVVAEEFRGKNRVQQQRMVNQALKSILDGPLHALIAVNFAQSNNLADMVKRVHTAGFKLPVVSVGLIGQGDKAHEDFLIPAFLRWAKSAFG